MEEKGRVAGTLASVVGVWGMGGGVSAAGPRTQPPSTATEHVAVAAELREVAPASASVTPNPGREIADTQP